VGGGSGRSPPRKSPPRPLVCRQALGPGFPLAAGGRSVGRGDVDDGGGGPTGGGGGGATDGGAASGEGAGRGGAEPSNELPDDCCGPVAGPDGDLGDVPAPIGGPTAAATCRAASNPLESEIRAQPQANRTTATSKALVSRRLKRTTKGGMRTLKHHKEAKTAERHSQLRNGPVTRTCIVPGEVRITYMASQTGHHRGWGRGCRTPCR